MLFSFTKGKDTNSLQKMGFITEHYIKFPGVLPSPVRICDVAACFIRIGSCAGMEAVEAITERNPLTIKARHFSYGDKEYDAATDMDEVTGIYREVFCQKPWVAFFRQGRLLYDSSFSFFFFFGFGFGAGSSSQVALMNFAIRSRSSKSSTTKCGFAPGYGGSSSQPGQISAPAAVFFTKN